MPHARATMKEMLKDMEAKYPDIFVSINVAFSNISDECFFLKSALLLTQNVFLCSSLKEMVFLNYEGLS